MFINYIFNVNHPRASAVVLTVLQFTHIKHIYQYIQSILYVFRADEKEREK